MQNNCDGCARGLAVVDGLHILANGKPEQACVTPKEKLKSGDKVVLKNTIFKAHVHMGEVGTISAGGVRSAMTGEIYVKWPNASGWYLASWLEKV